MRTLFFARLALVCGLGVVLLAGSASARSVCWPSIADVGARLFDMDYRRHWGGVKHDGSVIIEIWVSEAADWVSLAIWPDGEVCLLVEGGGSAVYTPPAGDRL